MLRFVDTARESIDQLAPIPFVNQSGEGKRLITKHVDHVFQVVGPFLDEALISVERIRLVAALAIEISDHVWDGKLRFPHGGRQAEGENRVDETVSIADANKPLPAKSAHLV